LFLSFFLSFFLSLFNFTSFFLTFTLLTASFPSPSFLSAFLLFKTFFFPPFLYVCSFLPSCPRLTEHSTICDGHLNFFLVFLHPCSPYYLFILFTSFHELFYSIFTYFIPIIFHFLLPKFFPFSTFHPLQPPFGTHLSSWAVHSHNSGLPSPYMKDVFPRLAYSSRIKM
jgi:hypothetical protein